MLHFLQSLNWTAILTLVVAAAAALIHRSIKIPSDVERASLLATLANDAAAVVVNLAPGAPWANLLRDTIARLASQSTHGVNNPIVLEQAATGALMRLGANGATGK